MAYSSRKLLSSMCLLGLLMIITACDIFNVNTLNDAPPELEWEIVPFFEDNNVKAIATDEKGEMYVAVGNRRVNIYRLDRREQWVEIPFQYESSGRLTNYLPKVSALGIYQESIYLGTVDTKIVRKNPGDSLFSQTLSESRDDVKNFAFRGDHVFAAALRSGLYHSDDRGATWEKIIGDTDLFEPYAEPSSLAFNSKNELFVGTRNIWGASEDKAYILRADPDFDTWSIMRSKSEFMDFIAAITVDDQDQIIAGTFGNGIIYSVDNGNSWSSSQPDLTLFSLVHDIKINQSGHLFVAATITDTFVGLEQDYHSSIYRLRNIGSDWEEVFTKSDQINLLSRVEITERGYLYALSNDGSLYRTIESSIP